MMVEKIFENDFDKTKEYKRSTAWLVIVLSFSTILFLFISLIQSLRFLTIPIFIFASFIILRFLFEKMTLKKDHIILKQGILSLKIHEIPYNKINSISIHQDIFGRIFGFGDIRISVGNESSHMIFFALEDPHEVKEMINKTKALSVAA